MSATLSYQQPQKVPMKLDTLSRILAEICQPGFQERRDDHVLREFVDSEARNFTGERFNRFALEMNQRIKGIGGSISPPSPPPRNDVAERMGGLVAIEELAGSKMYSGSPARLADLVKLLMEVFQPASDQQLMEFAARTLGHTVKAGGALMAGVVEEQVKLGLSWLSDRAEYHRLAGTLVLHELAIAAPAVFNVHVKVFVEAIWNGIRDPKLHIRETAVAALQACLVLIEKRETRYRVQWYYRLFEQTKAGLARAAPVEIVHGSLLALGELVRHTGEFMLARYREVCETVLRFRDSKEKLIRRAIITLLPRLAAFAPERFTKSYLDSATEHLLAVLGSPADRGAGFAAIAEMSTSLSSAGVASKLRRGDYLRPIALHIRDALLGRSKTKAPCSEALHCAGTLAVALGRDWQPYIPLLLEPMFQTGLSGIMQGSALHDLLLRLVLGIMGALDPHIHKLNLAELQGEGKLEAEGVRPQTREQDAINAANLPVGDQGLDLLPSAGLVTSSEDYYPTVAINALMRLLRNPGLSALHGRAVAALFDIIKSMGFNFVLYLPKVVPVLLQLTRGADDLQRRVDMVRALTDLVSIMRQHISRFLKDFLDLVHEFWRGAPVMQPYLLTLLGELSDTLQDDFHTYMPDLLPMFVAVFDDAERTGDFAMIKPALEAIRSLGTVLESSLQLLLPVLVRLITPGASAAPLAVQEETLVTMQEVLPKMQLAGYSSAILHPLTRLLDSSSDELRERALDTICAVALAVGPDFAVFVPVIKKAVARHRMPPHAAFLRIAGKLQQQDPPCMSDAEDWEHSSGFLAEEHLARYLNTPGRYAYEAAPVSQTSADEGLYDTIGGQRNGGRHDGVGNLRRAWESSQRSTKDDWAEWMRNFSIELLKQSPSKALRACASLSQANPAMARELFAAGFVSCWSELEESLQDQLVRSLEAALASPTIPPDIVTTLLNLAEFMEHDEKALPLDTRTLGALAEKCHAYAKALHYKELEYNTSPSTAIEALISINNHLRQPDAAVGILTAAQKTKEMTLKESWYEKLQRWDEALRAYRKRLETTKPGSPENIEALLGECRCLAALAEWEELYSVCRREWQKMEPQTRRELAPVAAHAAWQLGEWKCMEDYVDVIKHQQAGSSEGAFLSAVLHVKKEDYTAAMVDVDQARELLGTELSALVGESYERAYGDMVRVQQLTELEDILTFKLAEQVTKGNPAIMTHTKNFTQAMWAGRMQGVQRNVEVWQALLSVRGLLLDMHEDTATWLKFASLCRKSGRRRQSEAALQRLLQDTRASARARGLDRFHPDNREADVLFAWHKHQWATGPRQEAFMGVQELAQHLGAAQDLRRGAGGEDPGRLLLAAKVHMKLGLWRRALTENLSQNSISSVLANLKAATEFAPDFGKIWHHWALFNVEAMGFYSKHDPSAAQRFVAPAIIGFFRSIELGQAPPETQRMGQAVRSSLQDILRLLTLWFQHGAAPDVEAALADGFSHVNIDTWLVVIPQVIARIHTNSYPVRRLIHSLLVRIGRFHPQALMYPLLVACKSQSVARRAAAVSVMDNVRQHSATLVEQAQLVSQELIRMAVLWHEQWHESLEEASRLYFGESNVDGMLDTLLPLHEMMKENGPSTLQEIAFVQAYGRELDEAYEWCLKFKQSRREAELHQAWDLYYHVFRKINKQLPSLSVLELQYVAPALVRAKNLELAVPGTYIVGEAMVTIGSFRSQLHVITSKQRPRKLTILGSDGAEYMFLLKGHEDLRQDERVMQLFGLVNNMLANDRVTAERDLSIARYAVIPLSPNSGLIGWVPNTDTLHSLIREYRDARKIPLNVEHRLMLGMAPDYDHLTVIQKVEVFEHSLNSTSGEDLHKVLWLKSRSSEAWLDKRTNYTRSTAVMSMVGYILGLGDRHPSNLMLDRYSGKLLHIDFGDCFEASMQREKFPERVPFRLTRMMIKAFEISGIEGNFRATCNEVLRVLRSEKDSVMAMLEAFVHDPLINWRLLNANDGAAFEAAAAPDGELPPSPPMRESSRQEALASVPGDAAEALNERAVVVMKRLSEKLTGRDSGQDDRDADTVSQQVQRLIAQATSAENLSVMYIGWCAFW
ncbi:hypothetical protein APUTEX25_001027, partial [Auxenochlorella protothecoides]